MIGSVMTMCVITMGVSVPVRPSAWNSVNSGIRKLMAGVMRAIRITSSSLRAFSRAMP